MIGKWINLLTLIILVPDLFTSSISIGLKNTTIRQEAPLLLTNRAAHCLCSWKYWVFLSNFQNRFSPFLQKWTYELMAIRRQYVMVMCTMTLEWRNDAGNNLISGFLFEIVNPLGQAKKVKKVLAVYMALGVKPMYITCSWSCCVMKWTSVSSAHRMSSSVSWQIWNA